MISQFVQNQLDAYLQKEFAYHYRDTRFYFDSDFKASWDNAMKQTSAYQLEEIELRMRELREQITPRRLRIFLRIIKK